MILGFIGKDLILEKNHPDHPKSYKKCTGKKKKNLFGGTANNSKFDAKNNI